MMRIFILFTLTLIFAFSMNQSLIWAYNGFVNPDPGRISEDVYYLASDELEGRFPGTEGCELAAEYIKKEFQLSGLLPGDQKEGDYYQEFNITNGVTLGPENHLEIIILDDTYTAVVDEDFLPLFFSANGSVESEIVFAGYGITAEQYNWDDYAKIDADGKIVFCLKDEPGKNDPDSVFDGILPTIYSGLRWKAFNAKSHGAIALIVATSPMYLDEDGREEFISLEQVGGYGESSIPVIQVSNEIANLLFSTGKAGLEMFQGEMERHGMAFGAPLEGVSVALSVDCEREYLATRNVAGILPGSDSELSEEWVIIGAHYDHLGWGSDISLHQGAPEIHNGADDNASGTSGVLELARLFSHAPCRPMRSILFLCFSAEELGTLGSLAYLENPLVPTENVSAMINMDEIGRVSTDEGGVFYCAIHATGSAIEWEEIIPDMTPDGQVEFRPLSDPIGGGDYVSFYLAKIPVLNFFSGIHEDYHRPTDDADKINYEGEASVLAGVYEIVEMVADYPGKFTFQELDFSSGAISQDVGSGVGYGVYLGTVPDFANTEGGFRIAGVKPGSPAETGGLMAGDRILKVGEYDVSDIYTYTYALGEHEPGETVDIIVLRDDEEVVLTVTFGSRGE